MREEEDGNKSLRRRSRKWVWGNFQRDLMAGALMGGVVHTIVAPVERAKLLLQTQESNLAIVGGGGRPRFKGMLDCILRTVREEGILSLWRGNGTSVLRYYPSVALNFSLKGVIVVCLIHHLTISSNSNGPLTNERGEEEMREEEDGNRSLRRSRKWFWGNFQRDLMAGALMGGVVHTIVVPVERAKLLLQTQESNLAIVGGGGRPRFKGMLDCIFRNVREEGILSLWRSNGTSVLRYYPSVALNFSLKDLYRSILRSGDLVDNHFTSGASANFIAGAAAGCTTLVIIYPLDIAHTRLAADIGKTEARQFKGICHFLSTIRKKDGVRGIYRGLPASLHGMIVHRGLYFGGFDTVKEMMSEEPELELALWKRWAVAQAVSTSAGLLSYPLDTVRRRMMMQSGLGQPMYQSTRECWRKIYRKEGIASFYRGAVSNMFRSTGAAAILVLYDEIKKFMNWGGL